MTEDPILWLLISLCFAISSEQLFSGNYGAAAGWFTAALGWLHSALKK